MHVIVNFESVNRFSQTACGMTIIPTCQKSIFSESEFPYTSLYIFSFIKWSVLGTMVVSIVTELCPMSLSKLIDSIILSEVSIRSILKSILIGLGCLHKNGIAHRDIKSDNILISPNGKVYVSDLGYCDAIESDGKCPSVGMVGTPHWMAPEGMFLTHMKTVFVTSRFPYFNLFFSCELWSNFSFI